MAKLRIPVSQRDHASGKPTATVTLVEYGDYQCTHCGHAYPLLKKLSKEFSNDLRFVFRNFPLQESHPEAMIAAQAAESAALQHKFWEMHDLIFEHQDQLSEESLFSLAEDLDLDMKQFAKDYNSPEVISKIESDFESGIRSGVNGTPTFFINQLRIESYDESYESLVKAVKNAR